MDEPSTRKLAEGGSLRLARSRPAACAHFDLGLPALQRFDELIALALEIGRDLAQPLLESLPAALTELVHSLTEDLLGFARDPSKRAQFFGVIG